jgi:hypothetical protein
MKVLIGISKAGIGEIYWIFNNSQYLIKQTKITSFCKFKAIIIQLLDTAAVSNILLRKVAFYQVKQCHRKLIAEISKEEPCPVRKNLKPITLFINSINYGNM